MGSEMCIRDSLEEAQEAMESLAQDSAELGLPFKLIDPAVVHRKQ